MSVGLPAAAAAASLLDRHLCSCPLLVMLLPVLRSIRHSMKLSNAVWERLEEVMQTLKGEAAQHIGKTTRTRNSAQPFKGPPKQPKPLDGA